MLLYCSDPKDLPQEIWTCIYIYILCMYIIHTYIYILYSLYIKVGDPLFLWFWGKLKFQTPECRIASRLSSRLLSSYQTRLLILQRKQGNSRDSPQCTAALSFKKNIKSIAVCVPNDIPLSIPSGNLT
jgi:hypothetical protein